MHSAPRVPTFAELTTFRVGGTIERVVHARSTKEIISIVEEVDALATPLMVLGGGSNILARDEHFNGTVVLVESNTITTSDEGDVVTIISDAGVSWDVLVLRVVDSGWWGFENLSGIPGTVGAAPIQNIGAYGAELADTLQWVEVYDRREKKVRTISREECMFGYRTSIFKQERNRFVVLRVCFRLSKKGTPNLSYKDVKNFFQGPMVPTLAEVRNAVLTIRSKKFPDLSQCGTAGSFFMNPIVSNDEAARLVREYPDLPHFPTEGGIKISLAWLLDHVLHMKGMKVGGAVVWEAQPLVVVAERGATASDVRTLAQKISDAVQEKISLHITPEVNIV